MHDTGQTHLITVLQALAQQPFSCREFLPDPVPRETITTLLELARFSPSWCNTQPWHVIVTSGGETQTVRQGLSEWAAANPPAPDLDFPERYEGRRSSAGESAAGSCTTASE